MNSEHPATLFENTENAPVLVAFGGGVDSTALLVLLYRYNVRPDLITFADTGAEKPSTYSHIQAIDTWLGSIGFPKTTWCRYRPSDRVSYSTLEGNCLANETLPSIAFGRHSCSVKWKLTPQNYVVKGVTRGPNKCDPHPAWITAEQRGVKPIKLIGYDAGKADIRRSKRLPSEDDDFRYEYPLQTIGWTRKECVQAVASPTPV